jgi:hypothetical protein
MGFSSGMGDFIRDDTFVATSGRWHGRRGELGGRSDRVDRAIERPPSDEPPWRRLATISSPKPTGGASGLRSRPRGPPGTPSQTRPRVAHIGAGRFHFWAAQLLRNRDRDAEQRVSRLPSVSVSPHHVKRSFAAPASSRPRLSPKWIARGLIGTTRWPSDADPFWIPKSPKATPAPLGGRFPTDRDVRGKLWDDLRPVRFDPEQTLDVWPHLRFVRA